MPLRRDYQDGLTILLMDETLLHRITVETPTGQDDNGDPIYSGPMKNIRCYITGSTRRLVTPQGEQIPVSWEVLFDRTALVEVNSKLTNGLDRDGQVLVGSCRVGQIEKITSPKRGLEGQYALCTPY